MTSLSQHCDKILANLGDPAARSPRFDVVGDVGSGKTTLLKEVGERCAAHGLVVLDVLTPQFNSAKVPVVANVEACSKLIDEFFRSIELFQRLHPETAKAGSRASRAKEALGRIRSPNLLYRLAASSDSTTNSTAAITGNFTDSIIIGNLTVLPGDSLAEHELLSILRHATEEALRDLAEGHELAILVDNVHELDGTSAQDWLRAILRNVPGRAAVTTRHPGSRSWHQDPADRVIKLENLSAEEVGAYLRGKGLTWSEEDVRALFGYTRGHAWAVAAWCDLALHASAARFADLVGPGREVVFDDENTNVIERVLIAIDQIPVKVLGYQVPLSGLLAISERVTPGLIATLTGDAGQHPSDNEARQIYKMLIGRDFVAATDRKVAEGISLSRVISVTAWQRLKDTPEFEELHAAAELYERERVDLEYELKPREKQDEAFPAWTRFETPFWVQSVERWLGHVQWLDSGRFIATKPALVKLYFDAFWWWDDYFRSKASSDLETALRKVADEQGDQSWMNNLEKFSRHWVPSWDEAQLRSDPSRWRPVLDAIIALLNQFNLEPGGPRVPADLTLRRIYILLRIFYAKALWYSGKATIQNAEKADVWLAAAFDACKVQPGDQEADPNGWIGLWVRLRRAEIWADLDRPRAIGYLVGLDRQAMVEPDDDLRVDAGMLIGDLWWRSGEYASALAAYSRAILLSCAYNVKQEKKRKAANLYTKSLYESAVRRVEENISALTQAGDPEVLDAIDTALADMRQLFQPYWDRVCDRPDPSRFKLPVPPAWPGDVLQEDTKHFTDLEYLVAERTTVIREPMEPPRS